MNQPKTHINYWAKLEPGQVYHIYNHAVGHDNLFKEPANYGFFLQRWKHYWASYMDVYAYCLMPNHFHVVGRFKPMSEAVREAIQQEGTSKGSAYLRGEIPINSFYEDQFKRFFTSYSRSYGKAYNRIGSLFRAKFKRVLIRSQKYLQEKLLYVHHNPIHHGFCADYDEYAYSSYHDYKAGNGEWVYLPAIRYFQDHKMFDEASSVSLERFLEIHEQYRKDFDDLSAEDS